ncbi:HelD family protein [Neomicrococcus lactis]|uniref:DNA helicase IV n=1 Tax=Neomicrococcus lactis TaxID=732241 RepID=A0A7W8YAH7_9MICC|nr:UvrD-helicase domain-containing protein [Neomicrococcus lactis]MBB5597973.1 DNA helicase IV [Neomicrococcus lactis]
MDRTDSLPTDHARSIEGERVYVHELYERLDELRAEKTDQLAKVRKAGAVGTMQNATERDAFATMYEDRLAQLNAVEDRLVFGRLDFDQKDDGAAVTPRYIGRIGLTSEDQTRLMVDWRAPEASAFYQATAFDRRNVRRRRHLILKGREVIGVEDDVLDSSLLADGEVLQGGGALLAAVTQRRTGRMADIVATIQSEQDRIIRSPQPGVLVVQGGPGTGKTAVALHRAAYLLYEHRDRLKSAGVLLVGPSASFMTYIERVLPSLGETGVVMASVGRLMPGIRAVPETNRLTARVKGRLDMVDFVANAVAERQRTFSAPRLVNVEGTTLKISPKLVKRARDKARATGKPYNQARETFVKIMVRELAEHMKDKLEQSSGGGNNVDRSYLTEDVRASRDVRIALNLCWMPMTPEKLLSDLFANPERLAWTAPHLKKKERAALYRERGSAWTEADVPLLDEAAELLGEFDPSNGRQKAEKESEDARDLANAEQTLKNVDAMLAEYGIDGVLSAEELAAFNQVTETSLTAAERAFMDRTWAYGHVVVDEAQELSPMQWRLLMRRCPMKSFTIVGDIAQASSASASKSWEQALKPFVDERFRLEELTVNYRTPKQIAKAATRMARAAGLSVSTPEAVRKGEWPPVVTRVGEGELMATLCEKLPAEVEIVEGGMVAIIAPQHLFQEARVEATKLYGKRVGSGSGALDQDIVVTSPNDAKGLEYDSVIILEPAAIVEESGGSVGSLYVAMTRPTQRLHLIAEREIPSGIVKD